MNWRARRWAFYRLPPHAFIACRTDPTFARVDAAPHMAPAPPPTAAPSRPSLRFVHVATRFAQVLAKGLKVAPDDKALKKAYLSTQKKLTDDSKMEQLNAAAMQV